MPCIEPAPRPFDAFLRLVRQRARLESVFLPSTRRTKLDAWEIGFAAPMTPLITKPVASIAIRLRHRAQFDRWHGFTALRGRGSAGADIG
jgi:hypothetical protein